MIQSLFDRLAAGYDQGVVESDRDNEFPFAGYQRTLDLIAAEIAGRARLGRAKVLDLGIGTGLFETRLAPETIEVTGIDLSGGMLEICRLRLPEATLLQGDFTRELPEVSGGFDAIVSTWAMHHLPETDLVAFLDRLVGLLAPFGRIYVGDVLFADGREREACRLANLEAWDPTEHYHTFEAVLSGLGGRYAVSFMKTSFCAGILIVERFHELSAPESERVLKRCR
ncbi:MAG: class I SAM-dependent methyltransferase [Candidatus Izemoplasmatales bacterium]